MRNDTHHDDHCGRSADAEPFDDPDALASEARSEAVSRLAAATHVLGAVLAGEVPLTAGIVDDVDKVIHMARLLLGPEPTQWRSLISDRALDAAQAARSLLAEARQMIDDLLAGTKPFDAATKTFIGDLVNSSFVRHLYVEQLLADRPSLFDPAAPES